MQVTNSIDTSDVHQVFVEKLRERRTFEQSTAHLYETLLIKYHHSIKKDRLPDLNRIEQFYLEELSHIDLTEEILMELGCDPLKLTPAAEICDTAVQGWRDVISDKDTNFKQGLEIILQAELVDNASWEILIEISESLTKAKMAVLFQQALDEEQFHLNTIKQWVQELLLNDEVESPEVNFEMNMSDIPELSSETKHERVDLY